jgi:nitric oxide synthase oxygenase domain/subunit
LTEQYSKTFKQAGLKTIEEKDSSNDEVFGVTLATISQYTPEEYYQNKQLYEDYDEIGDYINRHMTRPLKNLQYDSADRDFEFFVPDNEEELDEDE